MAFKNVRNLLLINHNDGFIDDDKLVSRRAQVLIFRNKISRRVIVEGLS